MPIINVENLPLGYKYKFPTVEIKPFTYKSLMDYLDGMPGNPSDLYLYDLTWILRDDEKCSDLLVPDAEYLIFLKKAISIDGDLKFTSEVNCPVCGTINTYTFLGSEFNFVKPTDEVVYDGVLMELKSGTYLCKIPTVSRMLKVLELTKTYGTTSHLNLVKSIAMINEQELNPKGVEDAILGAGSDDIATILTVYDMLYRSLQPIKRTCKNTECDLNKLKNGGMSVEVSSLIGNVFRSILLSKPVDRNKIYLKQTSQDTNPGK